MDIKKIMDSYFVIHTSANMQIQFMNVYVIGKGIERKEVRRMFEKFNSLIESELACLKKEIDNELG